MNEELDVFLIVSEKKILGCELDWMEAKLVAEQHRPAIVYVVKKSYSFRVAEESA